MVETTFIYALNDPETGECRYVGKADDPQERFRSHLKQRNQRCPRTDWLAALKKRGLRPVLEILDEVPKSEWAFWERKYIFVSRAIGMELLNVTDGGDGMENPSLDTLKKMREKMRARRGEKRIGASSKFRGVCWSMRAGKWTVRIRALGIKKYVGFFVDEKAAAKAYDTAAKIYHGEGAKLNFPNE